MLVLNKSKLCHLFLEWDSRILPLFFVILNFRNSTILTFQELPFQLPFFIVCLQIINNTLTDVRYVLNILVVRLYVKQRIYLFIRLILKLLTGVQIFAGWLFVLIYCRSILFVKVRMYSWRLLCALPIFGGGIPVLGTWINIKRAFDRSQLSILYASEGIWLRLDVPVTVCYLPDSVCFKNEWLICFLTRLLEHFPRIICLFLIVVFLTCWVLVNHGLLQASKFFLLANLATRAWLPAATPSIIVLIDLSQFL